MAKPGKRENESERKTGLLTGMQRLGGCLQDVGEFIHLTLIHLFAHYDEHVCQVQKKFPVSMGIVMAGQLVTVTRPTMRKI